MWRRRTIYGLAVVVTLVAATAARSAAAAAAGVVVDKTFQCSTQEGEFRFEAHPNGPGTPPYPPAGLALMTGTGDATVLFGLENTIKGYTLDRSLCRPLGRRATLTRAKLVSVGTFRTPEYESFDIRCLFGGPVVLRMRAHFGADGSPISATIALQLRKHSKPVAYLTWSLDKVTAYGLSACGA